MIGLMVTEEKVAEQQARLSCEEDSKGIWLVHFICYWENVNSVHDFSSFCLAESNLFLNITTGLYSK